jgi:hypothetical protein
MADEVKIQDNSRLEDLQTIILNTLTYGSGSSSLQQQLSSKGYNQQEVYNALEGMYTAGTIKIKESSTEYLPITNETREWRKYALPHNPNRAISVGLNYKIKKQ